MFEQENENPFVYLKEIDKKAVNPYHNTKSNHSIGQKTSVECKNKKFGKSTFSKPFIAIFHNEGSV